MPVYSFRCRKCKRVLTVNHPFSEKHPEACECGGALARKFDVPNVVYRGSGYYHTDKVLYEPTEEELDDVYD